MHAHLVERDRLLHLQHVRVQFPDVIEVREQERALRVETARDDVARVLIAQAVRRLERQVLPQELLVVRELNDERRLEGRLQPRREVEGDEVAEVQRLRRGAAACGERS